MKLARRRLEEPQIGLTPLIDVVFLLLIFFMVTTTFVEDAGLTLQLPIAGAEPAEPEALPEVVVDAGGNPHVDGHRLVSRDALMAALADMVDRSQALRVRADARASHQSVVTVMDAAAAAGFGRIDIATQPQPSDDNS
ncbi:biopolymer transporter ExbD [Spectribacter hydrogenoxidans]|uniref:Biopolymer transporter ExbD n=1 Tax=Spectribacter hydrogenoxidans TaxID=3075608 RepID=A0ABU3C2V0_9GAMM|nr:biopolymer transporter ExbD [Salinisphaera sp. W335]MDT0635891.1 biopolymer transporter ExbD [Salinisphaera sp. W335]